MLVDLRDVGKRTERLTNTACIKGYYEVEKCIENAVKSRNFVSIFDTLRKYKSIQTFLVMPFTIPRKA